MMGRALTGNNIPKPITHGSAQSGYRRGCRCEPCTAAASAYMREYRRIRAYLNRPLVEHRRSA